jgi:GntR family phosphonate transport system transcriptional regulator
VLVAELLQLADEQPLSSATMYFPAARFSGLLDLLAAGQTVTQALQQLGLADYRRAVSRITTQLPDDSLARMLRQPRTRPVLCVESVDTDDAGIPVKYGITIFSGDRVQLVADPDDAQG